MENKTWAEFAALPKEDVDAYSPEELEELKSSITENEAELAKGREDELSKSKEYGENQKIRAEKAEKDVKSGKVEKKEPDPESKIEPKSDEPDYAKLAFLDQKGVEHPDDKKIVFDEAERLKLPLTDILGMNHIKDALKVSKDERESKAGMPKGKGRTGQASRDDIDYYMDKPDELPEDVDLAGKVIEARMQKHEKKSKFSEVLFKG